nr:MAG TPA: hypothetical protein [Caudoviricetes sp.]
MFVLLLFCCDYNISCCLCFVNAFLLSSYKLFCINKSYVKRYVIVLNYTK